MSNGEKIVNVIIIAILLYIFYKMGYTFGKIDNIDSAYYKSEIIRNKHLADSQAKVSERYKKSVDSLMAL